MNKEQKENQELKNLKYKTMFINKQNATKENLTNIQAFLENEKTQQSNETWTKLDKLNKLNKLNKFADEYAKESKLNSTETKNLKILLKEQLEKKNFTRIKDVTYDKQTGKIKAIPSLHYNKTLKRFTIKNTDKRVHTTKCLTPKRNKKTLKNKPKPPSKIIHDDNNKIDSNIKDK